jgi:hypothetical protein
VIVRLWLPVDYRRIKMQQLILGLELGMAIGRIIIAVIEEIQKER